MYVIRYKDLKGAINTQRNLVKLSDPNLWKPAWPEGTGDWQPGHEIRNEAIGISLFTTYTQEKAHYHARIWELYQVLEGTLRIAFKRFRKDSWSVVSLVQHDILLLAPGTLHLVDSSCVHTTQVIQAPPALADQIMIESPDELAAAEKALRSKTS